MSKQKNNGLALYDPRFAAFAVPGLSEEMDYLRDTAQEFEKEADDLRQGAGAIQVLEMLKDHVSFECARTFTPITIVACKVQRRRSSCHCESLKKWINTYVVDD